MSVNSTNNKLVYSGNGSTTLWSYTFPILASTDIEVTLTDASGKDQPPLTSGYTVDTANSRVLYPSSGTPLPTGWKITLRRVVAITQGMDLKNRGDLNAENLERGYDRLTMIAQQQDEELARAIKFPTSSTSSGITIPEPSAGKVLQWNPTGDGLENGPDSSTISGAAGSASAAAASATAAAGSATAASGSATSAAASAAAAATAASSAMWRDVVFITVANSPYTIDSTHRGKLICVDASGGAVAISVPQISGLDLTSPFNIGIKKTDASGNAVTVTRSATDTIDGNTSKTISVANSGSVFTPDTDPAPDQWVTADFGAQAGNLTVDTFSGDGSTTAFTLSVDPGSKNNTSVFVGGVYQFKSTYSISGTTLTFSSAPPLASNNIQVVSGTTLSIGTPSDGTVNRNKLALGAVGNTNVVAKTATYTATPSDDVILCSGGAFTINLPAAASNSGKRYWIKKTDSSVANIITIDPNSTETIDGSLTTTLNTQNEHVVIVSDGANWQILDRRIPSIWTAFTMALAGSGGSAPVRGGSFVVDEAYWRRVGDSMEVIFNYRHGSAGTAGTGNTLYTIPLSLSADTSKITPRDTDGTPAVGSARVSTGTDSVGATTLYDSTHFALVIGDQTNAPQFQAAGFAPFSSASLKVSFTASVPISGWKS